MNSNLEHVNVNEVCLGEKSMFSYMLIMYMYKMGGGDVLQQVPLFVFH